jgi:hypothetical protein
LQMKQPPSAFKWRKMIGKLEHQMLVDDEQNDYRKMIEMRRENFNIIYGGGKKRAASTLDKI